MKKQIIVIHGGDSYNTYEEYLSNLKKWEIDFESLKNKGWKNLLGDKLGKNFEVILPKFPNSANAKYIEWKIYFEKLIPFFNNKVILLGHSLGAIFLIKYLSENIIPKNIIGLFLVSTPYSPKNNTDFSFKINPKNIQSQCKNIFLYHSTDDTVVDFKDFEKYKKELTNAIFREFKNRGHFYQKTFPEIIKDIKNI